MERGGPVSAYGGYFQHKNQTASTQQSLDVSSRRILEDRYHATAIEINEHLQRCLVYIDLNMVRARVVTHRCDWTHSGYREIQKPPKRYGIIDLRELNSLCGFAGGTDFQQAHRRSDCRDIRIRDLPNSFLERLQLSVAIERLERFEPTDVGSKRSRWAIEFC